VKKQFALLLLALMFLAGCGASTKTTTATPGQPLDPQGNWLFSMEDSRGNSWQFAGQLYELVPPVVTGPNGLGVLDGACDGGSGGALIVTSAQASGTDSITLNFASVGNQTAAYTLTGTIATDQEHMSGTYTGNSPCGWSDPTGTWTAEELAPVTDTWTGTTDNSLTITAALTENTDQTSSSMGQVTGTVTVSGTCFTGPLTLPAWTSDGPESLHDGEILILSSSPDTNGATLSMAGTVDPAAVSITGSFTVAGGPCDGETFTANLTH
jgi:hypothetical protein